MAPVLVVHILCSELGEFDHAVVTDGSEAKLMVLREPLTVKGGQIAGHHGKGRQDRKSNRRQPLDWIPVLLICLKPNLLHRTPCFLTKRYLRIQLLC